MNLPSHLLRSFQAAYFESFGEEIGDEQADAMGTRLLDTLGQALLERAEVIHRSRMASVDAPEDKRDDGSIHNVCEI